MLKISSTPLEAIDLRKDLVSSHAGALSVFEGWVRDVNEGKIVTTLEYEAYGALCEKEAKIIFREAKQKFNIIAARAYHRTGKLNVGDMAVWVGVIAEHRDDSFRACRYIIDEIKARLPIWKKETTVDGESEWIACSSCRPSPKMVRA